MLHKVNVFLLQTKKFKELHEQLKAFCGIVCKDIYLRHIHKLLTMLMKDHEHDCYKSHAFKTNNVSNIVYQTFEDPYQELFIWAILTGKIEMVDFFWKRVQTPLIATITAASIYSKLSIFYNKKKNGFKDTDLLSVLKQKHQSRANQVRICVFLWFVILYVTFIIVLRAQSFTPMKVKIQSKVLHIIGALMLSK